MRGKKYKTRNQNKTNNNNNNAEQKKKKNVKRMNTSDAERVPAESGTACVHYAHRGPPEGSAAAAAAKYVVGAHQLSAGVSQTTAERYAPGHRVYVQDARTRIKRCDNTRVIIMVIM